MYIKVPRWKKGVEKAREAAARRAGNAEGFRPCLTGRRGCECGLCSMYSEKQWKGLREGDPVQFSAEKLRAQLHSPFIPHVISHIGHFLSCSVWLYPTLASKA